MSSSHTTESAGQNREAQGRPTSHKKKRYVVVDCEDADKWRGHAALHVAAFGSDKEEEEWTVTRAYLWSSSDCERSEVPPDPAGLDGVVITGSRHSAAPGDPQRPGWVDALTEWLERVARREDVRILGGCFGSQVLAVALGGDAGPSGAPFVVGAEDLVPTREVERRTDFARALRLFPEGDGRGGAVVDPPRRNSIRVLQSHGDCVRRLPPGAVLLAGSASCGVEVWSRGDNVLAWQCHPEFTVPLLEAKILGAVVRSDLVTEDRARAARVGMASGTRPLDHDFMLALGRSFLRGGTDSAFEETAESVTAAREKCAAVFSDVKAPTDEELFYEKSM